MKFNLPQMFWKLIFSAFKASVLVLVLSFFLSGQELNSFPQSPFLNCWEMPENLAANVASDNDNKIFLPLSNGIIKAIDIYKNEIWKTEIGGEVVIQPSHRGKNLYVLSKTDTVEGENTEGIYISRYSITALDKDSGITKWKKDFKSEQIPMLSSKKGALIIIQNRGFSNSTADNSSLSVLDENTGDVLLERNYNFGVKQVFNAWSEKGEKGEKSEKNENILMLTSLNSIATFSISNGKTLLVNLSTKNIQEGTVFEKGILVSNDRGNVYFIDSKGNEHEFKIRLGARAASITYYKDSLLISSLDNFVYSLSLDGRKINWKRRFSGRITEKPIVNQNAVVIYSQGDNSLFILNYDDGKVINRVTVTDKEEITGEILLLKRLLVVMTSKGIKVFSSDRCENLAAASR